MGEFAMHDTLVCPCFPLCNPRIVGLATYACFVAVLVNEATKEGGSDA